MSKIDLCWIDDSAADMSLIMEHVFPTIWLKGYSCKTILFGNDYCSMENEAGPKEDDRKAFEQELENFFIVFCQKIDEDKWQEPGTAYKDKRDLLPSPSVSLVPLMDNDKNTPDSFKHLANCWMDTDRLQEIKRDPDKFLTDLKKEFSTESNSMSVVQLIEKMNIPKDAVVALDICLLYHDIIRIEGRLPSISMALYHWLKKEHNCYLYSGRYDTRTLMNCWVETYQQVFSDKDELKIHPKKGLTTKQSVTDAKNDLLALLGKKTGGGS